MFHEDLGEIENERIYWTIRAMEKNAGALHAQMVDNKKRKSAQNKASRARNPKTPQQRVRCALRTRFKAALFAQDTERKIKGFGYTIQAAIAHLESLFKEGMHWGNHGEWEIDHVRPCRTYNLANPKHQRACFALKNIQPLWKAENRQKSGKWKGLSNKAVLALRMPQESF